MAIPIPLDQLGLDALVTAADATITPLSITDRYESQDAFMNLLANIGVQSKERFRLLHDGFTSIKAVVDMYHNDISGFKKQLHNNNKSWLNQANPLLQSFFTPVNIHKLLGVVYYYKVGVMLFHVIPDNAKVNEDDDITLPELKDATKWTSFKDSFKMLLSNTMGVRDISLSYVISDAPRAYLNSAVPCGEIPQLILTNPNIYEEHTVHFGLEFKRDNAEVYKKLKEALLNKPGYNHIASYDRSKDGRSAWTQLRAFYEGQHYSSNLREVAFSKLHNTFYRGEHKHFNFEKYVNIHKEAHKMLQDANYNNGIGMDNETKIQYFRNGIKADADLELALSTSRANPVYSDFDALISFLSAEVEHLKLRKAQLRSNNNKRVSGAGRGRGGGRGRGRGHSRGGGRGSGRGTVPFKWIDGKKVEGRWYDPSEFKQFNTAQQEAAKELFKTARDSRKRNSSSTSSQVSGLTMDDFHDGLNTLHTALISGVSRAQKDNDAQSTSTPSISTESDTSSRPSADSGSVGNLFNNRNKKRRRDGSSV